MQTAQQLVAHIAHLFPEAVFYKETSEKVVALTIDDVPTPNESDDGFSFREASAEAEAPPTPTTQLILDAIATHNQGSESLSNLVRATFFIISSHLFEGTTIIDRIVEQGHEIGNHGTADETTALLHPEIFAAQLNAAHQRISKQYQQSLRWYRPGRGLYNKAMLRCLRQMPGYEPRFALASMLPVDTFKPMDDGRFTAWYVAGHIFPGAILVLHGGTAQRCQQTATALTLLLDELKQRDYRTVTLSELWDLN